MNLFVMLLCLFLFLCTQNLDFPFNCQWGVNRPKFQIGHSTKIKKHCCKDRIDKCTMGDYNVSEMSINIEVRTTETFRGFLFSCVEASEGIFVNFATRNLFRKLQNCEAASSWNYFKPLKRLTSKTSSPFIKKYRDSSSLWQISFCIFHLHSSSHHLNILHHKAGIITNDSGIP